MTSNKLNNVGSSSLKTTPLLEQTVVLIKPGFIKLPDIEAKVTSKILSLEGIRLISKVSGRMTKEQAKNFYIDKKEKKFYNELTDYMSSDNIVAYIFESYDAIARVRVVVEELRTTLKTFYSIPDDVMKNILHATNVKLVDNQLSKIDAVREIKIINDIQGEQKRW